MTPKRPAALFVSEDSRLSYAGIAAKGPESAPSNKIVQAGWPPL
jgi:hypothetical protein